MNCIRSSSLVIHFYHHQDSKTFPIKRVTKTNLGITSQATQCQPPIKKRGSSICSRTIEESTCQIYPSRHHTTAKTSKTYLCKFGIHQFKAKFGVALSNHLPICCLPNCVADGSRGCCLRDIGERSWTSQSQL